MAISRYMKIHAGIHSHPKFMELSAEAVRLWLFCASWSGGNGTDGEIPRVAVYRLSLDPPEPLAGELVTAGLWVETEKGWRFHDWHDWNATAAEIKRVTEARSRGGKASAKKRWGGGGHDDSPESLDSDTLNPVEHDHNRSYKSLSNGVVTAQHSTAQHSTGKPVDITTPLPVGDTQRVPVRANGGDVARWDDTEAMARAFLTGKARHAAPEWASMTTSTREVRRAAKTYAETLQEMREGGISPEVLDAHAYALSVEWAGRFTLTPDTLWKNWSRAQEALGKQATGGQVNPAWMSFGGKLSQGDVVDVQ